LGATFPSRISFSEDGGGNLAGSSTGHGRTLLRRAYLEVYTITIQGLVGGGKRGEREVRESFTRKW